MPKIDLSQVIYVKEIRNPKDKYGGSSIEEIQELLDNGWTLLGKPEKFWDNYSGKHYHVYTLVLLQQEEKKELKKNAEGAYIFEG